MQNEAEVLKGEKPRLLQRGPYAYDEYYVKFDIEWSDNGNVITYGLQRYYLFNDQRSGPGLKETDTVLLPYPTVLGFQFLLSTISDYQNYIVDVAINDALNNAETTLIQNLNALKILVRVKNPPNKKAILAKIDSIEQQAEDVFDYLHVFILNVNVGDLLLKTLLCLSPNGFSPFWKVNQFNAWFGWFHDPILENVQLLLDKVAVKTDGNVTIPWTTAVPGTSTNMTTIADSRRRFAPTTTYTGKKNRNQASQLINFRNMTEVYNCVSPMNSQNLSQYKEGEEFPACEYFQSDWNATVAMEKGYSAPFATPYANRIRGTDGNSYGRPIDSNKVQVFVFDIFRSLFIEKVSQIDWHGVTLHRYQIQTKDLQNATANPDNKDYYDFGPSGLLNVSLASGVPSFASKPHFLGGDSSLVASVEGLTPMKDAHETYIDIEPQTGLLASANKRLQVNFLVSSLSLPTTKSDTLQHIKYICLNISALYISVGSNTSIDCNLTALSTVLTCLSQPASYNISNGHVIYPYGWADEHFELSESVSRELKSSLFYLEDIADAIQFCCLVIAGSLFITMLSMVYIVYVDRYKTIVVYGGDNYKTAADRSYNTTRQLMQLNYSNNGGSSGSSSHHETSVDEYLNSSYVQPLLSKIETGSPNDGSDAVRSYSII